MALFVSETRSRTPPRVWVESSRAGARGPEFFNLQTAIRAAF